MKKIIPSAYMTVRPTTLFFILEHIPKGKVISFTPDDIDYYKTKTGNSKKKIILNYLSDIGIVIRINGHYRLNINDEQVQQLYRAIHDNNDLIKKSSFKNIILRNEIIKKLVDIINLKKIITLKEVKEHLESLGIQKLHREQLKYLLRIISMAGMGEYNNYKHELKLSKKDSITIQDKINIDKNNDSGIYLSIITSKNTIFKKKIDIESLQNYLSKEELLNIIKKLM